jgi:hypothetical protein
MDFFTPCWKSARLRLALLLAALCCCAIPALAQSQPAEIVQMRLERTDEGVFLSAQVRFELAAVVQDALLKGIPVYFLAEAQLLRDRWYWSDKRLTAATRHMRLSYHPLTRRWRLSVAKGGSVVGNPGAALNRNFETLQEALQSLSLLSRWKIAEPADVDADARHTVDFSFRLDLSELPRPFQIGLLGQSDWTVSVAKNQRLNMELK